MSSPSYLSEANQNQIGVIVGFDDEDKQTRIDNLAMIKRLQDIGFEEGSDFEIMHVGPLGSDPLAVKIQGTTIALRRSEASLIKVKMKAA